MVFDLGNNPLGVKCKNTITNDYITFDISDYNDFSVKRSNSHTSTCKISYKAKQMQKVSNAEYERIKEELGAAAVIDFKVHDKSNPQSPYKIKIDDLTYELSCEIFGDKNTYYAIPIPKRFNTRVDFINALTYGAEHDCNKLSTGKYEVTNIDLDRNKLIEVLALNYELLNKDKSSNNVLTEVLNMISTEQKRSEEWVKRKLIGLCGNKQCGVDITDEFNKLGIKVLNDDLEVSDLELESITHILLNGTMNNELVEKYMRPATFEEALDIFDLTSYNEALNSSEKSNGDKDTGNSNEDLASSNVEIKIADEEEGEMEKMGEAEDKVTNADGKKEGSMEKENKVEKTNNTTLFIHITTISLNKDSTVTLEIIRENSEVYMCLSDEIIGDLVIMDNTITPYSTFINNGINFNNAKSSLTRLLASVDTTYTLESLAEELTDFLNFN